MINKPPAMLCQDCLRVVPFDLAGHQNDYSCECGGDWCGCEFCLFTVAQLRAGRRSDIGLKRPIEFWCEETGVKR